MSAEIVSQRLNRRKIDLIPEPAWADPPKARITELLAAVEDRLRAAGLTGLRDAVDIALAAAAAAGLPDARVTSDAKHVEIGLTDKSDSARWAFSELARGGIGPALVLVAGDEFGPLGGVPGSDSFLLVPEAVRATAISVGAEPSGTPSEVVLHERRVDHQGAQRARERRRGNARDPRSRLNTPAQPMIAHSTQNRSHRSRARGLQVAGATIPSAASDPSDAKEVTDTETEL